MSTLRTHKVRLTIFTARPSAVIATAFLSVCLSVCLSVRFWCFVQRNEDAIMWSSLSDSTIILVSEEVKVIWKFAGDSPSPSEGVKVRSSTAASENLLNNEP